MTCLRDRQEFWVVITVLGSSWTAPQERETDKDLK